jgi:hypothetical protein
LSAERQRLILLLASNLDNTARDALAQLMVRDDTLSELAALKQDAKNFGWRQMAKERAKLFKLQPLYRIAKMLIPKMAISQQNLRYYASLANFYNMGLLAQRPEKGHSEFHEGQWRVLALCYGLSLISQIKYNRSDQSTIPAGFLHILPADSGGAPYKAGADRYT